MIFLAIESTSGMDEFDLVAIAIIIWCFWPSSKGKKK